MNRRSFIKRGALFVPTIFIPRLIRAQSTLTAEGLASFGTNATAGGGGGGGCAYTPAPGFGTGNRTALITLYQVHFNFGGTPTIIIDGSTTGTGYFFGTNTLNGTQAIQFQFPSAIKITALKVYQSAGNSTTYQQGTWKLQGSNTATLNATVNAPDWTDAGTSFTFAGTAISEFTEPSSNTNSWTQYQMLGLTGTTNGGPWVNEFEFQYC